MTPEANKTTRRVKCAAALLMLAGAGVSLWLSRPTIVGRIANPSTLPTPEDGRISNPSYKGDTPPQPSAIDSHVTLTPTPTHPAEPAVPAFRQDDYWPQTPHPISLLSREVMPSKEVLAGAMADRTPHVWLAQFGGPIDDAARKQLSEAGIELLLPTVAMSFYVRATAAALDTASATLKPELLGWARLEPSDKIMSESPRLRVELLRGGNIKTVLSRAQKLGAKILKRGANWIETEDTAGAPHKLALELASLDDVYVIETERPRYKIHNEQAAANSNVPVVLAAPYNLDGSGVTVMVRDDSRIFAHPDFGTRLLFAPDVNSNQPSQHSTHVAGTIGGNGQSIPGAGARGLATGSTIVSYDLDGDETAEVFEAKNVFGALISNHSYGFQTGWDDGVFHDNQFTFGVYSTFARNWDQVIRSDSLIIIKSAGNDRADSGPNHPHDGKLGADGEYYDTVDQTGSGKNILLVGAAIDAAKAGTPSTATMVLPFSSSGPSADGRIRPELIADGESLLSTDNTPETGNVYVQLSGSSMATAVVSGATALFVQRYKQYFGSAAFCPPHYLRAAYAQTATDFGHEGPDYLHGFGMLDLGAAINLLDADAASGKRVRTSAVSDSTPERWYEFISDGVTPIKATLVWTDEPGDVLASKALVNDLDLRLVRADDQSVTFPYTLDPAAPEQPAKPGINRVDNIEQVYLKAPQTGRYLLAVRGSTLITPAAFALASSAALAEDAPPVPVISTSGNTGQPPFIVTFDGTKSVDPDGSVVKYQWSFGDGASAEGATVTHVYLAGTFQATLKVIDDRGASASTSVTINVNNKPPTVQLSASPTNGIVPLSVAFSGTGSDDPDGRVVTFGWDFGDGSNGAGETVAHTYAAPGLYWATLSVTDNGGTSSLKTMDIFAGDVFPVTNARFSLNFKKANSDSFTISTTHLPISPDVSTSGLKGAVQISTGNFSFVLDEKGNFKSDIMTVKLNPLRSSASITIKKAALVDALGGGAALNVDTKNQPLYLPFALTLGNGTAFGSTAVKFAYTAHKGRSGSARFEKQ